jgi:AraC-like DNA-binding protein
MQALVLPLPSQETVNRGSPVPHSSVRVYPDAEAAETAYLATRVELTPAGRSPFTMRVVRVELGDLWLQQVHESSARLKSAGPDQDFLVQGKPLASDSILRHSRGDSYHERTLGETRWCAISLPTALLIGTGDVVAGCDLAPPVNALTVIPRPQTLETLRGLHASASLLAENTPNVLGEPEVQRSLQQSLIGALVDCLSQAETGQSSWAQRCHGTIMRRFRSLLEQYPDRALYVPEICEAIRVPERTFRLCCQENLGMSPKHYLTLRRMNQAHRALKRTSSSETTVTRIATHFGFWHFGRFATTYRLMFNETPSNTLHRPPD